MLSKSEGRHVIVLSPAWPSNKSGYGLALRSSLTLYLAWFDSITFICLSENPFEEFNFWQDEDIHWHHIPVQKQSIRRRFLKSLLSLSPAINASYKSAGQKVCKKINEVMNSYPQTRHIIIEDIPLSIFLSKIKHKYTNFKIAIRSHNELEKAFEFFCKNGPLWWRAAWKLECLKIKMLEKKAGKESNIFWTISQNDLEAYIKRLNVYPKGVIGVYISNNFYKHIPSGSRNTVIYLGSADLRKGMGLKRFISKVWPVVRKARPDARLILAGFGTEVFSDPLLGVQGLGKIENDREVLEQGRIFINPQYIGSGIQLKSIVAMLSSKALVSTRTGVEGVNGENGKHFIIAELSEDMALEILSLMDNPDRANKIGQAAQKFASDMYNKGRLMKEAYQLLEEYVG